MRRQMVRCGKELTFLMLLHLEVSEQSWNLAPTATS